MEYFPVAMIFVASLVLIIRPFTALFHELGHAIPAILMTRQRVSIYLGSYGDPSKSLHFSIGLLDVWFKYNPFSWRLGLCALSAKSVPIYKQIIFTITGPLISFAIAVVACYFTFTYDLHGSIKLILVIFLCLSIFDLYINVIPTGTPIKLYDGRLIYNDGHQLIRLLRYSAFLKEYEQAIDLYNQQKFAEAATSFNYIIRRGLKEENIYRLAFNSFLQAKNYTQAKDVIDEFIVRGKMDSDDYANVGLLYSRLHQPDKALESYDKSLALNPDHKNSLNNKGFTLISVNKFHEAIPLFDRAIKIDAALAYSYNNRGLAKIKIGKLEEGLEDINHSIKLDENNSYAYRNLGIYHFDKGELSKALVLFMKAKDLDGDTDMIDELIIKAGRAE